VSGSARVCGGVSTTQAIGSAADDWSKQSVLRSCYTCAVGCVIDRPIHHPQRTLNATANMGHWSLGMFLFDTSTEIRSTCLFIYFCLVTIFYFGWLFI
jgi:hypothetical protein